MTIPEVYEVASRSVAVLAAAATVLAVWFPGLVIGLAGGSALLLLAYPLLREHRFSRPERYQQIAKDWEPGNGSPLTSAFLFGGPGRVTDLLLFELQEEGKLTLSGKGTSQLTGEYTESPFGLDFVGAWRVSPSPAQLHRSLHAAVLYEHKSRGQVSGRELRQIIAERPEIGKLWYRLAKAGLVSSRRQLRWIYKGLRVSVALLAIPLTVATIVLMTRTGPPLVAWGVLLSGAVGVALLGDAYLRALPRRLTGFHTDLRTMAGLRASELLDARGQDVERWRVAEIGLSQLRPSAGGSEPGWSVEPSFWCVVPVDSRRPVLFRAFRWRRWAQHHRPAEDASDGSAWQAATELGSSWIDHGSSSQGDGGSDGGGGGGGSGGGLDGDGGGDWN